MISDCCRVLQHCLNVIRVHDFARPKLTYAMCPNPFQILSHLFVYRHNDTYTHSYIQKWKVRENPLYLKSVN